MSGGGLRCCCEAGKGLQMGKVFWRGAGAGLYASKQPEGLAQSQGAGLLQ